MIGTAFSVLIRLGIFHVLGVLLYILVRKHLCYFSIFYLNSNNFVSLNSIWSSIGLTDWTFVSFLKVIFFILFIILNIALWYLEYLDLTYKNKLESPQYMESKPSPNIEHIKKAVAIFAASAGLYSSYITIKNEHLYQQQTVAFKIQLANAKEVTTKITKEQDALNFHHKINIDNIARGTDKLLRVRREKSDLMKRIEENKTKFTEGKTNSKLNLKELTEVIRKDESSLTSLDREENRVVSDLKQGVDSGLKFAKEISKETDESKNLKLINEDIKKSAIFDYDDY